MPWVLIPLVAIIAWMVVESQRHRAAAGVDPGLLADLDARIEAAEAEGRRLQQRIVNLEAIVTSEGFDLEREAKRALGTPGAALPESGSLPSSAIDLDAPSEEAPQPARRVRS